MSKQLHHYSQQHTHQFVTFRTQASVDEFVLLLQELNLDERNKQFSIDQHLDHSELGCLLNDDIIDLIRLYCQNLDPGYYQLIALSVMPNHIHMLFQQQLELSTIMHKVKGGLARLINKRLQRTGSLSERDYFDKAIRSEQHFKTTYRYIRNNAPAAGLIDADRRFFGIYE
jgi:REP element-mobilizing transposase RayT